MRFIDNLKIKYQAMDSSKKVAVALGLGFTVILFVIFLSYPGGKSQDKQKKTTQGTVELKEDKFVEEKWMHSASQKLRILQQQVEELQKKLEEQKTQEPVKSVSQAESLDVIAQRIEKMMQKAPVKKPVKIEDITPPSPVAPAAQKTPVQQPSKHEPVTAKIVKKAVQKQPQTQTRIHPNKKGNKKEKDEPKPQSLVVINITSDNDETETYKNATGTKKIKLYIPSTTFVEGMLLTGLDAPTGVKSSKTPHPVLLRLQDMSFLPNEVQQNLIGCRLLGEAYGELSSEKAYIRLVRMSCVDTNSHQVVDVPVKGYVVDNDGKIGLRGSIVSKQGMFLARSLIASFVDGIAQGFKTSSQTVVVAGTGTTVSTDESSTTTPLEGFGQGFLAGSASGAAKTAQKLSDFYMKLAEEMFPVIEIGARRHVTVVFTTPVETTFEVKFEQNMEG